MALISTARYMLATLVYFLPMELTARVSFLTAVDIEKAIELEFDQFVSGEVIFRAIYDIYLP
jgi:hypothetical protein